MDIFFLPGFDVSVQDSSLVDVHDSSGQLNEPISDEGLLKTPPTLSPLSNLLVQISTLQERGTNEDLDFCLSLTSHSSVTIQNKSFSRKLSWNRTIEG